MAELECAECGDIYPQDEIEECGCGRRFCYNCFAEKHGENCEDSLPAERSKEAT